MGCPALASFAAKVVIPENCDDCFFAVLGNDRDLDLALLAVKNGIRAVSLRDILILAVRGDRSPFADLGEEIVGMER